MDRSPAVSSLVLWLAGVVTLSGAAFTSPDPAAEPERPWISVAPVQMEPGGSELNAILVFSFGMGFKEEDLEKLENDLRAEMLAKQGARPEAAEEWALHTVIRTFKVVADNKSGYSLACIAWCLADGAGTPIYHEQFFSSAGGKAFAGLGSEGKVKRAIVKRITSTALRLRSHSEGDFRPLAVKRTFDSFDEATKKLPKRFLPGGWRVVEGDSFYRLAVDPNWEWAKRPENIRWEELLGDDADAEPADAPMEPAADGLASDEAGAGG